MVYSCVVTLSSNDGSDRRSLISTVPGENIVNKSIGESVVREFDVIGTSCFVLSAQNLKPEVTGIESRCTLLVRVGRATALATAGVSKKRERERDDGREDSPSTYQCGVDVTGRQLCPLDTL